MDRPFWQWRCWLPCWSSTDWLASGKGFGGFARHGVAGPLYCEGVRASGPNPFCKLCVQQP